MNYYIKKMILGSLVLLFSLTLHSCDDNENSPDSQTALNPKELDLIGNWQFQSVIDFNVQSNISKTWTINNCLDNGSGAGVPWTENFYFYKDNKVQYYLNGNLTTVGKNLEMKASCPHNSGYSWLWKVVEEQGKYYIFGYDYLKPEEVRVKYEILNPDTFKGTGNLQLKLAYSGGQNLTRIFTYNLKKVDFYQHEEDTRPYSERIVKNWKLKKYRNDGNNAVYDLTVCATIPQVAQLMDDFNIGSNNKIVQRNLCTSVSPEYSWSMASNPPSNFPALMQTNDGQPRYAYGIQYIDKYQMQLKVSSYRTGLVTNYTLWFRNIE